MRTLLQLTLGALTCLALHAAAADSASAQDRARPDRVYDLEQVDITGQPGPGAFYVVARDQGAERDREPRELRSTFVRRIVESVSREPF